MWANLVMNGQSVMVGDSPELEKLDAMCQGNPEALAHLTRTTTAFQSHPAGVGVQVYVEVEDVDAYHKLLIERGVKPDTSPTSQFYGIRDIGVRDADGYNLVFFTAISLTTCQSCGMPLTEAAPGQMYCHYCTDEKGELRPYDEVFKGTVEGFFMHMQNMPREEAEVAAEEMLGKMPAWNGAC